MYLRAIRSLLASVATCAALSSAALGQERLGDDRHNYEAPPLVACSDASGLSGVFIGQDQCVLVSGEARVAAGYDSSAGLLVWHSEIGRAVGALATDLVPVFGVLAVRNEGTLPSNVYSVPRDGLSLYEAYVAVGDDVRLTVGKAPSIIKTNDDRPLDWLGGDNWYGVFFPIENDGSVPLTANSVQLSARLSEGLQVALAWEDGMVGNFWYPELSQSRIVASARYDDGQTQANVLVARFGGPSDTSSGYGVSDSFSGRVTVNSLLTDTFRVLLGGSFGSDQSFGGMISARAQVGPVELAGTYQKVGGYAWSDQPTFLSGSLTAEISPDLAIRVGALAERREYDESKQFGVGSIFELSENAALELEIGRYQNDWSLLNYARGTLDWHISESAKARTAAQVTSDGSYKIESEIVTSFR